MNDRYRNFQRLYTLFFNVLAITSIVAIGVLVGMVNTIPAGYDSWWAYLVQR